MTPLGEGPADLGNDDSIISGEASLLREAPSTHSIDGRAPAAGPGGGGGPLEDNGDNIRVYVRLRPLTRREKEEGSHRIVQVDRESSSVLLNGEHPRVFTYDGVLDEDATQEETFDLVGRRIGAKCLHGYNGSVYVFGQTGVGKTYTMTGAVTTVQSMQLNEKRGLICRILDYLFAEIQRRRSLNDGVTYLCRCSFLEIYQEQITDLLEPGNTGLQIREDMSRGVYVERLSALTVETLTEAFAVLCRGLQARHVGSTHMNERSSRSHAVFTLTVEVAQTRAGVTSTRMARLALVDLAGSERQQGVSVDDITTPYESGRVKEAAAINKSLSALTNVIMSLSREERSRRRSAISDGAGGVDSVRRSYVHYRDSKLTFLLRDSLGGNSKTVIVANISPSSACYGETLSTLKFAARAKFIRCAAVRNEGFSGSVESLLQEVKSLRRQLANLSGESSGFSSVFPRLQTAAEDSPMNSPLKCSQADVPRAAAAFHQIRDPMHAGEEDVLCIRRRVRRLEVLLAAGLERERHAEHRRYQLQKLAQFLEDLDFRKTTQFRKLHAEYEESLRQVADSIAQAEAMELTSKLRGFGRLLGSLTASGYAEPPVPEAPSLDGERANAAEPSSPIASVPSDGASPSGGLSQARLHQAPPARKRGTSQAMQRNGSGGIVPLSASAAAVTGQLVAAATDPAGTLNSKPSNISAAQAEEAALLREENRRLRQQLENHPEVSRLLDENHMLHKRLSTLDASMPLQPSPPLSPSAKLSRLHGATLEDAIRPPWPLSSGVPPPLTSELLLRGGFGEGDEDKKLQTWVYFRKMAKEIEELLRAQETLTKAVAEARGRLLDKDSADEIPERDGSPSAGLDEESCGRSKSRRSNFQADVEPQAIEDFYQTMADAVQLAQAIIDISGLAMDAPPSEGASLQGELVAVPTQVIGMAAGTTAEARKNVQSTPQLEQQQRGGSGLSMGNGTRDKSVSSASPETTPMEQPDEAGLSPPAGGKSSVPPNLMQALRRVKHVHSTLDLVNSACNDAYDRFQSLREEYESRVEECQFFELQCSRLDLRCQQLTERLQGFSRHGRSYSATGLAQRQGLFSKTQRSFSMSSLRDAHFWEQRFQELSQLTGIAEGAGETQTASGSQSPPPRRKTPGLQPLPAAEAAPAGQFPRLFSSSSASSITSAKSQQLAATTPTSQQVPVLMPMPMSSSKLTTTMTSPAMVWSGIRTSGAGTVGSLGVGTQCYASPSNVEDARTGMQGQISALRRAASVPALSVFGGNLGALPSARWPSVGALAAPPKAAPVASAAPAAATAAVALVQQSRMCAHPWGSMTARLYSTEASQGTSAVGCGVNGRTASQQQGKPGNYTSSLCQPRVRSLQCGGVGPVPGGASTSPRLTPTPPPQSVQQAVGGPRTAGRAGAATGYPQGAAGRLSSVPTTPSATTSARSTPAGAAGPAQQRTSSANRPRDSRSYAALLAQQPAAQWRPAMTHRG